jgi:hypothetical protein
MSDDLQLWANMAQVLSLFVAILALILQIASWIRPTPPSVEPIMRRIRPLLPYLFIAGLAFWLGTRTLLQSSQPVTPTLVAVSTPDESQTRFPVAAQTPATMPTLTTPSLCVGQSPGNPEFFSIYPEYDPSGYLGDTGDIVNVDKGPEVVRFTLNTAGQGPHEWEYKYKNGELNPEPAKFGGVMYLCCGWGDRAGFDLRAFRRAIKWEARCLSGNVDVEFVIGGVDWVWDENNKVKVSPPCPDSLVRKPLGTHTLTEEWQSFEVDLLSKPDEEFVNVIGGFAWVITWGSNEIQPGMEPKTFVIEIRNIRFER